jgi:hypothetical protein
VVCGEVDPLTIVASDETEEAVAQADCASHDRIEDRLDVGRRLADDLQDFARGRLLLERLRHLRVGQRERTVPCVQLGEQPRVLDSNDGLVGEGLQQRELIGQ